MESLEVLTDDELETVIGGDGPNDLIEFVVQQIRS